MNTQGIRAATRLILTLAAAAGLSGCVAYGPPYPAYGAAPVAPSYYSSVPYDYGYPYSYGYGYGYGYGRPAWVGPPVALNFGFYNHSYRGYRGPVHRAPAFRGPYHRGGPGWHGAPGGRGPGLGGGRGGGGHGGFGGGRGGYGGGRGHR